jgi:D-alanine transfer protein
MRAPFHRHLTALLIAVGIIGALLTAGTLFARFIERRALHRIAPQTFDLKNHGIALQREAFRHNDLLPLYGSSELMKPVADKAGDFFRREPTGFEVFPVGKAGTTSIIVLQKLAALGADVRGRKLAISLSPSWFSQRSVEPDHYAGNFSLEQACALAFSTRLSMALKRETAHRLLDFPETLGRSPVLAFALRRLASDTWTDRMLYRLAWPLGRLESALLRVQDHFHTLSFLAHHWQRWSFRPHPAEIHWQHLFARAAQQVSAAEEAAEAPLPLNDGGDATYLHRLAGSGEWNDLDLLLRGLRQLGAKPLLLSMPINGAFFDRVQISPRARAAYYDRLEALAARYRVPLVDFRDHDEDPAFLADTHDHLSPKGWLYFDAAIDAFYHDRPLEPNTGPRLTR